MCKAATFLTLALAQCLAALAQDGRCRLLLASQEDVSSHPMGALFNTQARDTEVMNERGEPEAELARMSIGNLNSQDEYFFIDGKYHFELVYMNEDGSSVALEWTQSSWLNEDTVADFQCISNDCQPSAEGGSKRFHGLRRSNSPRYVLDGQGSDENDKEFWNTVGLIRGKRIPAWNGQYAKSAFLSVFCADQADEEN